MRLIIFLCFVKDGLLVVEMAIHPGLILLLISRSSKDVQNCAYSPCLFFISGLLVQRREADFKEKWALQDEARRRRDMFSAHWLHHQWRRRQLYHHGRQPPGGDAGLHAVPHSEEGAVDIIVNKPWEVQVTKGCWGKWMRSIETVCNQNTGSQFTRLVSRWWVTPLFSLCQRTLVLSIH